MLLVAAALYALGAMLIGHWFADAPSLPLAAVTLLVSASVTLALVPLEGMPSLTTRGTVALLVLGAACTAGGMAAFFALIAEAGAHSASLITYAAPVVAVAVGWAVRDQPVTLRMLAGTALVLLGAWVCMRGARTAPPAPVTAPGASTPGC